MLVHVIQRLPSLHLTASKDPFREPMQYVQIKTFDQPGTYGPAGIYATATDAHTLVFCNLADHLDGLENVSGLENVPGPEILIKADQYKKMTGPKVCFLDFAQAGQIITMDKQCQQLDAVPYLTADQGPRYPDWPNVLPSSNPEGAEVIGIHPEKIGKVCAIMNAGPLVFEFRGPAKAVIAQYLEAEEHGTGKALIMPLYLSGTWNEDREQAINKADQTYQKAKARKERTEGTTA